MCTVWLDCFCLCILTCCLCDNLKSISVTGLHQIYISDVLWGRDECVKFLDQRVKVTAE